MLPKLTLEHGGAVASCPDREIASVVCDEDALLCVFVFWNWFIISFCLSSKLLWQPTVPVKLSKRGCEGNCWMWMRPSLWGKRTITKENLLCLESCSWSCGSAPHPWVFLWGGLSLWAGNSCPFPCCAGWGCRNCCPVAVPKEGWAAGACWLSVYRGRKSGEEQQMNTSL